MKTIYADNAATTAMSDAALRAMMPYLKEVYGNPSSLHTAGQTAKEALERARADIGGCLNADPREIYFTSGGSESDNQAIRSCAENGAVKGKKHIITTAFEHHAVLHTVKKLEKEGFEATYLGVGADGFVTAEQVKNAIRPDTALVTVMYANNEVGTIHGPKGAGALYCRRGLPLKTFIEGGAQERGRRAGTENIGGICAMAEALKEACAGMKENTARLTALRDKIIDGLLKIPHSRLNGGRENRLPANVNMCFEGIEGEGLLLHLDARGICASSGSACTSGSLDPSHVLLALGLPHEIAHGSLRISLSEYNTEEDADAIIKAVPEVVKLLRDMSPVWDELEKGQRKHLIK